jgi:hypothetical protein
MLFGYRRVRLTVRTGILYASALARHSHGLSFRQRAYYFFNSTTFRACLATAAFRQGTDSSVPQVRKQVMRLQLLRGD